MTKAEIILWSRLRRSRDVGARFRRQHPIGPFIADFASIDARLVVEIDGATHSTDAERAYDQRRENYLKARGWRVLRVTNLDVYENLDAVLQAILDAIPPPRRNGGPPRKWGRKGGSRLT
jgi:very-short-patch-repair endonuclease